MQVRKLFPSAKNLKNTWNSVVKIGQSLYREAPGMDEFRPDQVTPAKGFFLAGSYTKQDYIDSMWGILPCHDLYPPVQQALLLN